MEVNKLKNYKISISRNGYKTKEEIDYSTLRFDEIEVNNFVLLKRLIKGYSIAPIIKDYNNTLSLCNIKETSIVGIDIDKTNYKFNEFIELLKFKPTIAYTTFSNTKENNRFRLIYVFEEAIEDQQEFETIYNKIAYLVERDTKEGIKDNCGKCFNRLFNGTNEKATTYKSDIIYSTEDFNLINIESIIKHIKPPHSANPAQIKVSKDKETIPQNLIDLLNTYDDYDKLFLHLTKELGHKVITESEIKYNSDGYADLTPQYMEIKIIFNKSTKKPKVYKDGEGRKHLLYTRLQFRKAIKPSITMEELLANALFDIKHFIDNSDGEFHKKRVLDIVKSVFYDECNIKKTDNKKSFKVDKTYCLKNGITPNQYKMVVRKIKNDESIGGWYDVSKSVKDNLEYAKENNLKVSRRTLYNFCERNGINTKGENKGEKEIDEEIKPKVTTSNTIDIIPKSSNEIENIIKTNYPTYHDFINHFDDIKTKYKGKLEKEKNNNVSRWMILLKYYQELKITA